MKLQLQRATKGEESKVPENVMGAFRATLQAAIKRRKEHEFHDILDEICAETGLEARSDESEDEMW